MNFILGFLCGVICSYFLYDSICGGIFKAGYNVGKAYTTLMFAVKQIGEKYLKKKKEEK